MSEQKLDTYTYAAMKGAAFSVGKSGVEWVARCINPRCSSLHDAFSVRPEGKQSGRWAGYGAWMCRKCWNPAEFITVQYGPDRGTRRKRGWGDIAALVMLCEGLSYADAERFIVEYEGGTIPTISRPALVTRISDEAWQAETLRYLQETQRAGAQDRELLRTYLASRGLIPETVLQLGYGFSRDKVRLKDKTFREIPFLVIPWYKDKAANTLYRKVNRRNLHIPLPEDEPKYKARWQSENNTLYLGESLLADKRPTFLLESELDVATVLQEAGDLVNVVGTGAAVGGRNAVNAARLRRQPFVFVSFDDDDEGEKASNHWIGELDATKCVRYKPLLHDANEMHMQGMSVRKWVEAGLAHYVAASHLYQVPKVSTPAGDNGQRSHEQAVARAETDTLSTACTVCGAEPEHYCNAGIAYCGQHWPYEGREPVEYGVSVCCVCGAQAEHAGPLGSTYCTEHYQCIRGHVIRWRKDETSGSWSCACQWEEPEASVSYIQPVQRTMPQQPMTEAQFMAIVERIAAVFPGGATIHRDPPGYTIQDRARELAATLPNESKIDYWANAHAKMLRSPENSSGKPFYTPAAWDKKYTELKNWRPDDSAYAHIPGGYAGYRHMHQPGQEAAAAASTESTPQPTIAKRRKGRTVPRHITKPTIQAGPEDIEALCQKYPFTMGKPCEKCGCPVQYERSGYTYCARCHFYPFAVDDYSGIIDAVYPRLMNSEQATRKA